MVVALGGERSVPTARVGSVAYLCRMYWEDLLLFGHTSTGKGKHFIIPPWHIAQIGWCTCAVRPLSGGMQLAGMYSIPHVQSRPILHEDYCVLKSEHSVRRGKQRGNSRTLVFESSKNVCLASQPEYNPIVAPKRRAGLGETQISDEGCTLGFTGQKKQRGRKTKTSLARRNYSELAFRASESTNNRHFFLILKFTHRRRMNHCLTCPPRLKFPSSRSCRGGR